MIFRRESVLERINSLNELRAIEFAQIALPEPDADIFRQVLDVQSRSLHDARDI
jgi:hypothetical protein